MRLVHRLCLLLPLAGAGPVTAQSFNAAAPNGPDRTPAFVRQTRARVLDQGVQLRRQVAATGLDQPRGMDQLPGGSRRVTEKPERMRITAPAAARPTLPACRRSTRSDMAGCLT